MTSLDFLGLSSQSISVFVGPFRPENPETDWDDKPGASEGHPNPFQGFLALFRPEKPETDWDDKLGLPRVVIPVRFGFFGLFSARKS